jgi:hypothetical protein
MTSRTSARRTSSTRSASAHPCSPVSALSVCHHLRSVFLFHLQEIVKFRSVEYNMGQMNEFLFEILLNDAIMFESVNLLIRSHCFVMIIDLAKNLLLIPLIETDLQVAKVAARTRRAIPAALRSSSSRRKGTGT